MATLKQNPAARVSRVRQVLGRCVLCGTAVVSGSEAAATEPGLSMEEEGGIEESPTAVMVHGSAELLSLPYAVAAALTRESSSVSIAIEHLETLDSECVLHVC